MTFLQPEWTLLTLLPGMLQSWNKFCFTTGYIEISVSIAGDGKTPGLWPAAWTMANLGRAGYGATTEGTYLSNNLLMCFLNPMDRHVAIHL